MIGDRRIGLIGAGAMGEALISALLSAGITDPGRLFASDPREERRRELAERYNISLFSDNLEVVGRSDVIILSVKPQVMPDLLDEIGAHIPGDKLVISIAAGIDLYSIERYLPGGPPVIRVMPNTPARVREGVSCYATGSFVEEHHCRIAEEIFRSVGRVYRIPEKQLDAVTGLSGSGPAYVFLIIEALSDAGVLSGLPREMAIELAAQTLAGAARMVLETGEHPARLREAVTSPSGTTIAALRVLERAGLRGIIMDAVAAAVERSKELGNS